jgi:16S rRNA G966 N2-methylase RsmD
MSKAPRKRVPSVVADTAAKYGVSKRTVQYGLFITKNIGKDVRELFRDTPLANRKRELIELARWTPESQRLIVQKILSGEAKKVKEAVLLIRREMLLQQAQGAPDSGRLWQVWHADIATWEAPLKYDFIITDPPDGQDCLERWSVLARRAAEWLADGGMLVAIANEFYLPGTLSALSEHLDYYCTATCLTRRQSEPNRGRRVRTNWRPVVCFVKKGDAYRGREFDDIFVSPSREKDGHDWQQYLKGIQEIVQRLCLPGHIVLDPFLGTGAVGVAAVRCGCIFHGIDADPDAVQIAKMWLYDEEAAPGGKLSLLERMQMYGDVVGQWPGACETVTLPRC